MKIASTKSAGVTGVDDSTDDDAIQLAINNLDQIAQALQTQQLTGASAGDPTQLATSITNNLKALQGPEERGQLSPDQNNQLKSVLQSLGDLTGKTGIQAQGVTGFPTDDKYEADKVGAHKGGGHHVHASPPVDDPDADANQIQNNPTRADD